MRSILIVAFLTLFCVGLSRAQDKVEQPSAPDFDQIKQTIFDEQSPFYYPKLFTRYIDNDTTLTLQEYRHLYYGYFFNENYKPLKTRSYTDSLSILLDRNIDGNRLSPELFADVERICNKTLVHEPFTLSFINLLTYIYQISGDQERAKQCAYKMKMIRKAILSSGTGVTEKSPWYVLFRRDMQDIMNSLRARPSKRLIIAVDIEYYHLPVKNGDVRGYYFNTGRMYLVPSEEGEPAKTKRKFEFNPLYNPKSSRHIRDIKY